MADDGFHLILFIFIFIFQFRLENTIELFELNSNLTDDWQLIDNSVEPKIEESEVFREHENLMTIEVKCEAATSDEEQNDENTQEYSMADQCVNEAEAVATVSKTKYGRAFARLSMDSSVSADCSPSTSNIPVTPRIDVAMAHGEMAGHEEDSNLKPEEIVKQEEIETTPTSTGCEMTIMDDNSAPHCSSRAENQPTSSKRLHESNCAEIPAKKQKINEVEPTQPDESTRMDGEF